MLSDQHFEFGDDLLVTTNRELSLNQLLAGIESKLIESRDRPLCEGLVCEFGQRRPAPECLRLGEVRYRVLGATPASAPRPSSYSRSNRSASSSSSFSSRTNGRPGDQAITGS